MNFHQYKIKYAVTAYDQLLSTYIAEGEVIDPPPFFIMGSGRTGTTLMSCILNNHEDICIPSECDIIPMMIKYWYRKRLDSWESKVDFVMKLLSRPSAWVFNAENIEIKLLNLPNNKRNQKNILQLVYSELAIEQNKPGATWGEKKPTNTYYSESIRRLFPMSKQLFLLRDPRDVIASFIKIDKNPKRSNFFIWRWKNASMRYFRMKNKYPDLTRLMRYEDFVSSPEEQMKILLKWLKLPYSQEIFHNYHKNMSFAGTTKAHHHQNILKPITKRPAKIWSTPIEKKILYTIEKSCRKEMKILGY